MKKSLLALAVAAALPAVAQAQSSVTLYGIADVAVEWSNAANNGVASSSATGAPAQAGKSGIRVNNGGWTGSRLGVRGTEPLGNSGLKAIFNIEHRFNVDTGAASVPQASLGDLYAANKDILSNGSFWNGVAWVGLETGLGNITLGRQYTPAFFAMISPDFSANSGYNNWSCPINGITSCSGNFNTVYGAIRADNSVMFTSAPLGGLVVRAMWAPGALALNSGEQMNPAGAGNQNIGSGDLAALAGEFRLGKLLLTGSYSVADQGFGSNRMKNSWTAAASYNTGSMGLSLGYGKVEWTAVDTTNILLSAYAKVGGAGRVVVSASQVEIEATKVASFANGDGMHFGVTYLHDLSNRTTLYAGFGRNSLDGYKSTATTGFESGKNRVNVGLTHRF